MNKSFGKEQVQATAAQLFAQLPAEQSNHLVEFTEGGQQKFIDSFGIDNYMVAMKPYFEGELAMLILNDKPTGKIAEVTEIVIGDEHALVRFTLDDSNLRLPAHEFATKFSVIGGLARGESGKDNRELLKFIDAFTRAHYLGAWLKNLEAVAEGSGCGDCEACSALAGTEALGESGIVPEQPVDGAIEALLSAGAVVEGGQVGGDEPRVEKVGDEPRGAEIAAVIQSLPPHLQGLAAAIVSHVQGQRK